MRTAALSISLLSAILTSACSVLDFEKPQTGDQPQTVKAFDSHQFYVISQPTDKPNEYQVAIHVPSAYARQVVIEKKDNQTGDVVTLQVPESNDLLDLKVKPKSTYDYAIGNFENGIFKALASQSVKIPIDLVYDGVTNLPLSAERLQIDGYERIFLNAGAVIHTGGQNVSIKANEIISAGGRIETFSDSELAPRNIKGHSGGSIRLNANRLSGPLQIVMRGQTGGQGIDGNKGTCADRYRKDHPGLGHEGAPGGDSGVLHLRLTNFKAEELLITILPGSGGPGGLAGLPCEGRGQKRYGPTGPSGEIQDQDINEIQEKNND